MYLENIKKLKEKIGIKRVILIGLQSIEKIIMKIRVNIEFNNVMEKLKKINEIVMIKIVIEMIIEIIIGIMIKIIMRGK